MELFYFSNAPEDKGRLNELIKKAAQEGGAEFLQSFEWGDFLSSEGEKIIRLGVKEGENILLAATLVQKKIFNNLSYWYCPRGPIYDLMGGKNKTEIINSDIFNFFIAELKKLDPRAIFLRFEPLDLNTELIAGKRTKKISLQKTINLQPAETLIIDLEKSEEELLKEMHQKTRYNIRLAEKKGIIIREGSAGEIKDFWHLLKKTGERDNFRLHSFRHYEKLLFLNKLEPGFIKLYFAEFEGKKIAGGIFSFYGDKVTYLHGASDNEFRNLMSPYLLQWELITKAKEAGYRFYDFYGIDEKKWPGVTRFKTGYGGRIFNYAGTYDIIFKSLLYRVYGLIRKLRRLIK